MRSRPRQGGAPPALRAIGPPLLGGGGGLVGRRYSRPSKRCVWFRSVFPCLSDFSPLSDFSDFSDLFLSGVAGASGLFVAGDFTTGFFGDGWLGLKVEHPAAPPG